MRVVEGQNYLWLGNLIDMFVSRVDQIIVLPIWIRVMNCHSFFGWYIFLHFSTDSFVSLSAIVYCLLNFGIKTCNWHDQARLRHYCVENIICLKIFALLVINQNSHPTKTSWKTSQYEHSVFKLSKVWTESVRLYLVCHNLKYNIWIIL